ncbi:MAG: LemA family protein, partial [Cyanobacteria bacterium J06576_12]
MNSNIVVPENMVSAVLEKASRLYQVQQTDNSYTLEQMMAGGSEVEIPPELMQQAYLEVQKEFQAAALQAKQQQKMLKIGGIAAAAFLGIATLWTIGTYNALNTALGSVDGKWAQVENQMQRRADLIPQLTNIADGFADREAAIITSLNDSRQAFIEA